MTFRVSGLPAGTLANAAEQSDATAVVTLTSSATTPAGTYALEVTATDGTGSSASQNLALVLALAGTVRSTADQTQSVNGKLEQFLSTSFHWDYDADRQFGEVDYTSGAKYLSYWVDYWLGRVYPQSPAAPDILGLTITETSTVETLATKNSDGSVLLMVADRAVLSPRDNNGTGDRRTVVLDVSSLGPFTSASQLNIGATSDPASGPQPTGIALESKLTVNLPGYAVSFVLLKP